MKRILIIVFFLPTLIWGQTKKKQITKLNFQLDSLVNIVDSLKSVVVNQEKNFKLTIEGKDEEISNINTYITSVKEMNDKLKMKVSYLENKIEKLNNSMINPYNLSKGVIDHRLFSFVHSEKFKEIGKKDLTRFKNINNVKIDSNLVTNFNNFWGTMGTCVDWSLVYIEDIYYFKEGKVLIIHVYYPGDFESDQTDTYVYYLYDENLLKFQEVFSTEAGNFEYNYETNYFFTTYDDECSSESEFYIYDQNLKCVLSAYSMEEPWETMLNDLEDNDYTCSWGDNNRILIKNKNNKLIYMISEDMDGEWILINY